MNKQIRNSVLLAFTATIWGTAFVAQSVGIDALGPFTFNAIRCLIGGLFLIPCIYLLRKINQAKNKAGGNRVLNRRVLLGGILCGIVFALATNLQSYGLKYTTVGKAGFITSSYIVIVPLLGLFLKKKVGFRIWSAVGIAMTGLYLLCIGDDFTIGTGDLFVMLSAIMFSVHILVIDHFACNVDGVVMSCIQFLVCGVLSCVPAMFETVTLADLQAGAVPLAYAGILSCGVAYTLQIIGQQDMDPAIAALILSLESCISVLAGWLLLSEVLSMKEGIGCVLMFMAIVIAQLPQKANALKLEG